MTRFLMVTEISSPCLLAAGDAFPLGYDIMKPYAQKGITDGKDLQLPSI